MRLAERAERWRRWVFAPWSEPILLAAIIAAAAAPALLLAAGDHWLKAASDDVAGRIVARQDPDDIGLDLSIEAVFDNRAIDAADQLVQPEINSIDRLGPVRRTIYTLPTVARAEGQVVTPIRLMAAEGALEAVGVADVHEPGGVWISRWLSERYELQAGDELVVEATVVADEAFNDVVPGGGTESQLLINGVYETIWSEDNQSPAPFWQTVPATVIPKWIQPFRAPSFTLVLTDDATLGQSRMTGFVRWRARAERIPETLVGARGFERDFLQLESNISQPGELADALARLGTDAGQRAVVSTGFYETMREVRSATRRIGPSLRASRATGVLVGLATVTTIGAVLVERRRSEFRLLAGEGERWIRLSARVATQLAVPVAIGTGAGLAAAGILSGLAGPAGSGFGTGTLRWWWVFGVATAGLLLASLLAGLLGQATVESIALRRLAGHPAVPIAGVVSVAGFTALLWVQAGEQPSSGTSSLGIAATMLPVSVLLTAMLFVFAVLRLVLVVGRRASTNLPVPLLLMVRRLGRRHGNIRLAAGLLGAGLGLLAVSIILQATLDRTVVLRLATEIGGTSAVEAFGNPSPQLPAATTEIRIQDTEVVPGSDLVRVLAVAEGWQNGVTWLDDQGVDVDVIVELLERRGDVLPAVLIASEELPESGAFGRTQTYPYRVAARVRSLPRAGQFGATLLVSAEALDDLAFRQAAAADRLENFEPPTSRYRRLIVSQLPLPEVLEWAEVSDVGTRDERWTAVEESRPDIAATRYAFDFISVVGVVAALVGATALALQLSGRRRTTALSGVMLRSMGLSSKRSTLAVVAEVVASTALVTAVALALGPVIVRRLIPQFDPSPGALPAVQLEVPWLMLLALMGAVVLLAGLLAFVGELVGSRRSSAEVIREYA